MSLSVVAGRSHSGFRAAVYGIRFDPWGFDTLLYFVKMVAVFCFNGCREITFFVYAKELPAEDCPTLTFFPLRGSILRLRRAPSLRGYSLRDYLTFAFIPLRRIGFKQSQTFLDDVFYVLPHVFEVVLDVKV